MTRTRNALAVLLAAAVVTGAVIAARAVLAAWTEAEYLTDETPEFGEDGTSGD